jgi:FkbM family methyltransferase
MASMNREQPLIDDLIFDVGMHNATDTEFYLRKGFRVVGVEANADLCRLASSKLNADVAAGRLTIVNKAIADRDDDVTFYVNELESEWSTTDAGYAAAYDRQGAPSRKVTVPGTRFCHVLEEHGVPYYLKIDIEGADLLCVADLADFETRPRFVSIESPRTSFDRLFEQLSLLWRLGYRSFKIVPQHQVTKQICPAPAREGIYVDHHFGSGSSGLFGEELPGEWLDPEATFKQYRRIFALNRWFGPGSPLRTRLPRGRGILDRIAGWYDIHARSEPAP